MIMTTIMKSTWRKLCKDSLTSILWWAIVMIKTKKKMRKTSKIMTSSISKTSLRKIRMQRITTICLSIWSKLIRESNNRKLKLRLTLRYKRSSSKTSLTTTIGSGAIFRMSILMISWRKWVNEQSKWSLTDISSQSLLIRVVLANYDWLL